MSLPTVGEETTVNHVLRHTWFVERQVTIFPYTCEKEIDTAGFFDALLISGTFSLEVLDGTVENMDLVGGDVDVREELCEPMRAITATTISQETGTYMNA